MINAKLTDSTNILKQYANLTLLLSNAYQVVEYIACPCQDGRSNKTWVIVFCEQKLKGGQGLMAPVQEISHDNPHPLLSHINICPSAIPQRPNRTMTMYTQL